MVKQTASTSCWICGIRFFMIHSVRNLCYLIRLQEQDARVDHALTTKAELEPLLFKESDFKRRKIFFVMLYSEQ